MLLTLHGVFLVYLLVALAWNMAVSGGRGGRTPWERRFVVPLVLLLIVLLVADRLRPASLPLVGHPALAALFPLAFALAVAQNVHAIVARGARLTDIPIVLANVGLLLCTALGTAELAGAALPPGAAGLLYDHAILQHLLGSPLAHLSTLSWHVPLLLRRDEPASWAAVLAGLLVAAIAGFSAALLAGMLGTARGVLLRFGDEPRVTALRPDLEVHATLDTGKGRPFVLQVEAPASWLLGVPEGAAGPDALIEEAARLAQAEPDLLLPFPDPDGVGSLLLGYRAPQEWRALYERAAQRIHAISPGTRVAARLAGTGPHSRELFMALAAEPSPIAVAGPRLLPASASAGGPAAADAALQAWATWRAEVSHPPELWVLAASCSAPAYGEAAQARFVEGCLARASAHPEVRGIVFDEWFDRGHTLGLMRADAAPRLAATRLFELLTAPRAAPAR